MVFETSYINFTGPQKKSVRQLELEVSYHMFFDVQKLNPGSELDKHPQIFPYQPPYTPQNRQKFNLHKNSKLVCDSTFCSLVRVNLRS